MVKIFAVVIDRFRAKTVECLNRYFVGIRPDNTCEARPHRCRAAVGKREAQNVFRQRVGFMQNICDAHAQQLGLAGAWPCHYEQRSVDRINRLALGGVKFIVARVKSRHCIYCTAYQVPQATC